MAKINKYWGYVAIGAVTAAAAGAVAALIAKKLPIKTRIWISMTVLMRILTMISTSRQSPKILTMIRKFPKISNPGTTTWI